MIKHSVILKLHSTITKSEKEEFFQAVDNLKNIPNVGNFEVLRQVSKKNTFEYGILMEFKSQKEFDEYASHPTHVDFIENYWLKMVADFLETDFAQM